MGSVRPGSMTVSPGISARRGRETARIYCYAPFAYHSEFFQFWCSYFSPTIRIDPADEFFPTLIGLNSGVTFERRVERIKLLEELICNYRRLIYTSSCEGRLVWRRMAEKLMRLSVKA